MSEDPLVSVIMPAFKMGKFISQALDSVAAQTYTHWEVIVVDDDGPEDGTHAVVQDFAAKHPTYRVELIRHERNRGVSATRNTAIEAAFGGLLAFLDPDDQWMPKHLEQAVNAFRKDTTLTLVSGPAVVFTDAPQPPPKQITVPAWQRDQLPQSLALYDYVQPSATVVRREAVVDVGGFDTDMAIQHIEDYDLWIRLAERGHRFRFLTIPGSYYRKHEGGATADLALMDRLHAHLESKHAQFFKQARAVLHMRMLSDLETIQQRHLATERRYNGPVFRLLLAGESAMIRAYRFIRGVRRQGD